jgi:hypothetical protein
LGRIYHLPVCSHAQRLSKTSRPNVGVLTIVFMVDERRAGSEWKSILSSYLTVVVASTMVGTVTPVKELRITKALNSSAVQSSVRNVVTIVVVSLLLFRMLLDPAAATALVRRMGRYFGGRGRPAVLAALSQSSRQSTPCASSNGQGDPPPFFLFFFVKRCCRRRRSGCSYRVGTDS